MAEPPISIEELNKLSYKDQRRCVANKLLSMKNDDIRHFIFFKRLQVILNDLLHLLHIIGNNENSKRTYAYTFNDCFNDINKDLDDYFDRSIKSVVVSFSDQNNNAAMLIIIASIVISVHL